MQKNVISVGEETQQSNISVSSHTDQGVAQAPRTVAMQLPMRSAFLGRTLPSRTNGTTVQELAQYKEKKLDTSPRRPARRTSRELEDVDQKCPARAPCA